jgi:NADPH-dependent curcumin reductase CurA
VLIEAVHRAQNSALVSFAAELVQSLHEGHSVVEAGLQPGLAVVQGLGELGQLVASGKLIFRETIADGLSAAPEAFLGLLHGQNFGKQLVKLI